MVEERMKCKFHVLTSTTSNLEWMKSLGIKSGLICQKIRSYAPAGGKQIATTPVRCMVASKNIVRGERICVVPPQCVVTGDRADNLIREICDRAQQASLALPNYTELVSLIRNIDNGVPELLLTRDGLLLTLLLFLLRSTRYGSLLPPDHAHRVWARHLPPQAPPLGLLLRQHYEGNREHVPLQHRLVMNKDLVTELRRTLDAKEEVAKLMDAAVEADGLEALRTPRIEVAVTEKILSDFYNGRCTALTRRQHEMAVAHALRHASSASLRHLIHMESRLHRDLVLPLLKSIDAPGLTDEDTASPEDVACMHWAHFMMRSRIVNICWRHGPQQMALVPFLDCLNHSHSGANVVYFQNPCDGAVIVTASRPIAEGEELVMQYSNYGQRGCLFGDTSPACDTAAAPEALGYGKSNRVSPKTKAVMQHVRAIEAKQRREMQVDEDTNTTLRENHLFDPDQSRRIVESGLPQEKLAQHEAVIEATWLWRYGFIRSDAEKSYEASQRWSNGLRNRIANLTDVRRKGRPGEFVIGVPEGLEYLRSQREALEREWYHNTRIFPPQQA
ncbi:unnamed protein product [Phytomonas sp. EM1]|nr:unnamed protein product [Phytomonas sp. EM1]|eukprot:CCW64612.1 unnamed protein product [Phytomonas sp. isolate EM1]